jgi:hypothetical protein
VLLGAILLVAASAACSSGGSAGSPPAGSTGPAPAATTSPTAPAAAPTVPAGWTPARQGDLVFALPPGFTIRPQGSGMPGASNQWTKTDDATLKIPPAVAVFVETGRVGPLGVRTDLIAKARTAELSADPVGPARSVQVPGSTGTNLLEWRWDYAFVAGQPAVPSRQVELVVQTSGEQQYGLLLGSPATYLTDALVEEFTSSVAVLPTGGAA